ncbi:MAG: hypothetical protein N4A35_05010 [Flavobacteriales bacterium]|jgi:hypothetical protein|nr:hypothetical protein [Flavobacteriales bacterium]
MKTLLTTTFTLITVFLFAQDVKLKVTYKGQGVSGHTVSAYIQGQKRGSGVTNDAGEATIHINGLNSLYLDWKGEKRCDNGEKKWEVNGYGKLDENNFFHLKMEEITEMMAKESGGFISESMLAASYGLVCGGSSATSSNSPSSSNSSSAQSNDQSDDDWFKKQEEKREQRAAEREQSMDDFISGKTREEGLQNQKVSLNNSINSIEQKIQNKEQKIAKGKVTGKDAEITELEIKELKFKKEIKLNKLEKVNLQLEKNTLTKAERTAFKDRENKLEAQKKEVKEQIKAKQNSSSNYTPKTTEKVEKEDHLLTQEDIAKMSTKDLKLRRAKINPTIGANKMKLKLKSKSMGAAEKAELEIKNTKLSMVVDLINNELEKREK